MYPEVMSIPMREELTRAGVQEARTAAEVDAGILGFHDRGQRGKHLIYQLSIDFVGVYEKKRHPGVGLGDFRKCVLRRLLVGM